ncbi:MAG: hypothetical protein ACJA2M_000211 [Polaribacter sp.]|jgi:hypothetical protein
MDKNKTGKYLKYAFGEIVLVMIGILLALSINNWNENRKDDIIRKNYYNQILQDLNKDTNYINRRIKELEENILLYENYNTEFSKNESVQTLVASQAKLVNEFKYLKFNTNTIKSLESSGDIKLIPTEMRNRLIDIKNNQDIIITVTSGNNQIYLKDFMSAVNLGYSQQIAIAIATKNNKLISELKVNDNLPQIALILNGAYVLKNLTEKELIEGLKSMLVDVDNLSKLVNTEIQK